ncbi:MAG: NADH-quinone oxidoreductase subunit J [Gemmata sp.]
MYLFALSPTQQAGGQIALAALLGVAGFFLLLPRPKGRFVAGGIAALLVAAAVLGTWIVTTFGKPMPDVIGTALFALFSAGALGFGTVLVVQKNPARGAIAFAFVILSTCGLFLLLAAPFLMAATIIIYAGAIIVTFMFVLMLSNADGPSDENDRSREPLAGAFAGFAFVGLVLFTLYQTSQTGAKPNGDSTPLADSHLLAPVVTADERKALGDIATRLETAEKLLDGDISTNQARDARVEQFERAFLPIKNDLSLIVGGAYVADGVPVRNASQLEETGAIRDGSIRHRLEKAPGRPTGQGAVLFREDQQAREALRQAAALRKTSGTTLGEIERAMGDKVDHDAAHAAVRKLRSEVLLLRGASDLPAGNVRGLGFVLYSDHLLAIELAGTLLLVTVIGAIAVAHRKGVAK